MEWIANRVNTFIFFLSIITHVVYSQNTHFPAVVEKLRKHDLPYIFTENKSESFIKKSNTDLLHFLENKPLNNDVLLNTDIINIKHTICSHWNIDTSMVHIFCVYNSVENAASWANGVIVFNSALLEKMHTYEDLFFVLAHEMAHLKLKTVFTFETRKSIIEEYEQQADELALQLMQSLNLSTQSIPEFLSYARYDMQQYFIENMLDKTIDMKINCNKLNAKNENFLNEERIKKAKKYISSVQQSKERRYSNQQFMLAYTIGNQYAGSLENAEYIYKQHNDILPLLQVFERMLYLKKNQQFDYFKAKEPNAQLQCILDQVSHRTLQQIISKWLKKSEERLIIANEQTLYYLALIYYYCGNDVQALQQIEKYRYKYAKGLYIQRLEACRTVIRSKR